MRQKRALALVAAELWVATPGHCVNYLGDMLMACGVSVKLKATLPDSYRAGWLDKLDRRTRVAKAIMQRIAALTSDAGGADTLSHA